MLLLLLLLASPLPSHADLVRYFPLQGDLVDRVSGTYSASLQGSSACASFSPVAPLSHVWTQSCGAGQNPATLNVSSPAESGEVTLSVYMYTGGWSQENSWIFSCDGYTSGAVDCIDLRYDSAYGIMVGQLNANGGGQGVGHTLPASQWFHLAVTYSAAGTLTSYVNGAVVNQVGVSHSTSTYGAPTLAGLGLDQSGPVTASFINFRQYNVALTQAQVQQLTITDAPGYVPSSTAAVPATSLFSSSVLSSSVSVTSAAVGGGGGPTSAPSPLSSRFSSSLLSSSPPAPSSSAPAPTAPTQPTQVSAPGLVHWYPLQGDYRDLVNASTSYALRGDATHCVSFPSVGTPASVAWTQSCGSGSNPAVLDLTYPGQSGEVTLSVYMYTGGWSQENSWIFSCDGYTSGAVDCIDLRYDSAYGIMVGQLNANGGGQGVGHTLPASQWFHLAVTYSAAGTLTSYVNGAVVNQVGVSHSTSTYGAPTLAGLGLDQSGPVTASFINFRQYNVALTQAQVQQLTITDAPGYVPSSTAAVPATSLFSSSVLSSSVSVTSAAVGGGGGPTSAPSPLSSRFSSSLLSSSPPAPSSSAPAPTAPTQPTQVSAPGLVHWYPLQGDYRDLVNASTSYALRGDATHCVSFPSVGTPASVAWTQSCGSGSNPAVLDLTYPGQSGEVTLSVYMYTGGWSQENSWIFSCDGYTSGAVDCIDLRYDSAYGIMVGQLNANGGGQGVGHTLPASQWFHLAVTYSAAGTLTSYVNGAVVNQVGVSHSTSTYGAPTLAGLGLDQSGPVTASFINFRQYNVALTQAQVQQLTITDAPGYVQPVSSSVSSSVFSSSASPISVAPTNGGNAAGNPGGGNGGGGATSSPALTSSRFSSSLPSSSPISSSAVSSSGVSSSARSSSAAASSSLSSSALTSAAVPAATSVPSPSPTSTRLLSSTAPLVSIPGLVHWYPLQGDYTDYVNASVNYQVQGGASCASFTAVPPAAAAWTQSCLIGQNPATLALTSPVESGDVTLCVYAYVPQWTQETSTIFSCNGFDGGYVDCLNFAYDSTYGIVIGQWNTNVGGNGVTQRYPTNTWFHVCVTYVASTGYFTSYLNAVMGNNFPTSYSTYGYGAPVLAGRGTDQSYPVVGSFVNFRQYNIALTQAQIQQLKVTDYPGYTPPVSSSSISSSVISSSSVVSTGAVRPYLGVGLLHFLPLQGSYVDLADSSFAPSVLGASGCVSFGFAPVVGVAWRQGCAAGSASGVGALGFASPAESPAVSLSIYAYVPAWSAGVNYIWSCSGFVAGSSDCIDLWYNAALSVLGVRLHSGGPQQTVSVTLPSSTWLHLAATYNASTQLLRTYAMGQLVHSLTITPTNTPLAPPVLATEGDSYTQPTAGSFINYRMYNVELSLAQIRNLTATDAPTSPNLTTPQWTAVFMLAGQSNMVGFNYDGPPPDTQTVYDLPQITQLGRYTQQGYSADGYDDFKIVEGMDPLEFDNSGYFSSGLPGTTTTSSGIGPGMSFAYSYVLGTGQPTTLIPCAVQSSAFPEWSPGNGDYNDCLNRTLTVLQMPYYYFGGILWSQGEANSDGATTQTQYTQYVQQMVSGYRTAFSQYLGASSWVFLAMQMRPAWVSSGEAVAAPAIQQALNQLPWNMSLTSTVYGLDQTGTCLSYGNGDVHYSAAGQRYLGIKLYQGYLAAQSNYNGSVTPGVIVQTFIAPINNRQQMGFSWVPDPIAVAYRLTVTNGSSLFAINLTSTSFSSAAFLDPTVNYTAYVQGIGPTGKLGPASPPNSFVGVHPYSYYTAGYPAGTVRPYIWMVADSLFPQTGNNGPVSVWEDVSGNNNPFLQSNTQFQPDVRANVTNSHAAVVFSNSWLDTGLTFLPTTLTFTMVLSIFSFSNQGDDAFLGTNLFALYFSGSYLAEWMDFPSYGFTATSNTSVSANNAPTIVTAEWFIAGNNTETAFYINGAPAGSGLGPQYNSTTSQISVGARLDDSDLFFGNLFELLIYNQAIADKQRVPVEAYLAKKYNITLAG